tara:strand:- start:64 stop:660 length:597 start_codon:yes stop_codon:yes gene_type:complete
MDGQKVNIIKNHRNITKIILNCVFNLIKMKKILIITFLLPLFAFSQPGKQMNNEKMKKVAFEKRIIDKWEEYSKAFEYADYEKITTYFTYPLTFSLLDKPRIINNKQDLINVYKNIRSNVQEGYKYSLLDKSRIIWLSKDIFMIDATYSRYNKNYKRIYQGRGVYMYKKVEEGWKIFSISSLPMLDNNKKKKLDKRKG